MKLARNEVLIRPIDRPLDANQIGVLREEFRELMNHEPIPKIGGQTEFWFRASLELLRYMGYEVVKLEDNKETEK